METELLRWFDVHGTDLPWRRTRDPYAILVSEVMLQQTQVSRVAPRYEAWLERWPDVHALAAASPADVIREWQGLGYNRRGLNLHRAARAVDERGWPDDLTELPGVGPYTAAAVRAFAFGDAVLPRDTNVLRIEERTGHSFDPSCGQALWTSGARSAWRACRAATSARSPRDVRPAAGATRRSASSRPSRARSASAAQRCCGSSPESPRPLEELDGEAVEALERDGLVATANGTVRLPA